MKAASLIPYTLATIGLGAAANALNLHLWAYGEPAAGLFPFLASLLLIGASLASTRGQVPDAEPVEITRLLVYGSALGAFCFLLEVIGFALSTFLFLAGVFALIERMNWKRSMLLAAIFSISTWALFEVLLSVPLPHGEWSV